MEIPTPPSSPPPSLTASGGASGAFKSTAGDTLGAFNGGEAAIKAISAGRGRFVHFEWLPGLSYSFYSGVADKRAIAAILGQFADDAAVSRSVRVGVEEVEAPLLTSSTGDIVPLLNWAGGNLTSVQINVTLGYAPSSAQALLAGKLTPLSLGGGVVSVVVPRIELGDMIVFRK